MMDLMGLAVKIKHLRQETAQQLKTTGDEGHRREMHGYLRALDQVDEIIKLARDAARLEQQLARKRSLLEQDPAPDWSHLTQTEHKAASTVPRPVATSLHAQDVSRDKLAA